MEGLASGGRGGSGANGMSKEELRQYGERGGGGVEGGAAATQRDRRGTER